MAEHSVMLHCEPCRELYGFTLPQLRAVREHGLDATLVEAELLRGMRGGPRG
ncbi:hypothetical protein ACFWIB_01050 [Streptomyces sp. NPDC127051]|uniref:hypothetical protein n=1 Tax=Streptomyces sp. NPDC127051 TaxID=3347119 RepID=UPI00365CADB9